MAIARGECQYEPPSCRRRRTRASRRLRGQSEASPPSASLPATEGSAPYMSSIPRDALTYTQAYTPNIPRDALTYTQAYTPNIPAHPRASPYSRPVRLSKRDSVYIVLSYASTSAADQTMAAVPATPLGGCANVPYSLKCTCRYCVRLRQRKMMESGKYLSNPLVSYYTREELI